MTARKPNFNIDVLYLARKDELSEGERYGYLRAIADVQPRIDALVAVLRDVEWVTTPGEDESHCPGCEAWQHTGHAPTCDIAAALKLAVGKE